jgi:hypothetical protein
MLRIPFSPCNLLISDSGILPDFALFIPLLNSPWVKAEK